MSGSGMFPGKVYSMATFGRVASPIPRHRHYASQAATGRRVAPGGNRSSRSKLGRHVGIFGLTRTPGKLVYVHSVPWVRIPPRPLPHNELCHLAGLGVSALDSLCANSVCQFTRNRQGERPTLRLLIGLEVHFDERGGRLPSAEPLEVLHGWQVKKVSK